MILATLVSVSGVSSPEPTPTGAAVAEAAERATAPVGATHVPVAEQATVAWKLIGFPWTTVAFCPLPRARVIAVPAPLDAAFQLFTRALTSIEPSPVVRS